MTQSNVATKVALRINLKKDLIKAGLSVEYASQLTTIVLINTPTVMNNVIGVLDKLKT